VPSVSREDESIMPQSETMRAASRLLRSHPIVCLLAALAAAVVVVLGVLGPIKVVHAADVAVEGENFAKPPTGTTVVSDTLFSGGQALKFTADVTASHTDTVTCSTPCDVVLMARAGQSGGRPSFSVNGSAPQAITTSNQVAPEPYRFMNLPAGSNEIRVTASGTGTGHNAFLDVASFPADGDGGTGSAACADGSDNDLDGKTDHPNDPGCLTPTDTDETDPAATPLPPGFTQSRVVSGLTNPMDMEFAPDGRLFVAEQAGRVRIVKPDGTLATFLNISTKVALSNPGGRGLLALTFDPSFATNRYVYLHYTRKATSTTPVHNRIVRVTAEANGTKVVSGSETLIFKLDNQSTPQHHGGALDFGKDGKLYIVTGDNQTSTNSQQLTNLFGKMLRINKDGTIPTDNPFYARTSGNNRAIWALGLRNPFKFAVQPGTSTTSGTIFINDAGEKAWEEINRGAAEANYGWNIHEGPESDPQYVDPIFAYGPDSADTTGCSMAITGGTFYNPTTVQFPEEYEGDYFFADYCNDWIKKLEPSTGEASDFATGIDAPIDLEVSKGGELYYLSRGSTGLVGKIR
jgi:glucose/arabinose dehydrogenase